MALKQCFRLVFCPVNLTSITSYYFMPLLLLIFLLPTWLLTIINPAVAGPLHDAARDGKPSKISRLINKGANVNATNYFGLTPLLLAELNDHPQSAGLLRSHGAVSKKNELTKTMQHYLAFLGYAVGSADGALGAKTQAAILAFQQQQKLPANGKLSEDTIIRLHRQTMLKVQTWLQQQSLYTGTIDGLMGPTTEQALLTAEHNLDLAPSGRLSLQLLAHIAQQPAATITDKKTQASKTTVPINQIELVRHIQQRLNAQGFSAGPADGKAGPATRKAISAFQKKAGLAVDGIASEQVLIALDKQLINAVQSHLLTLGYNLGRADGKLGQRTETAIRAFQKLNGLPQTGQVSVELAERLQDAVDNRKRARTARQQRQLDSDQLLSATTSSINQKSSPAIPALISNDAVPLQQAAAGHTDINGPLRFQRSGDGTLLGCSIKGVQLENAWCQPFVNSNKTNDCKVTLRANSSVLLVKCQ